MTWGPLQIGHKNPREPLFKIILVDINDMTDLPFKFPSDCLRYWNGPVLFTFPIVDGDQVMIEIKILYSQLHAFRQTQTASVQKLHYQIIGYSRQLITRSTSSLDSTTGTYGLLLALTTPSTLPNSFFNTCLK